MSVLRSVQERVTGQVKEQVKRALPIWLAAAWTMSLSTLGLFVVPMLFAHLPTPAQAGVMAGYLFSTQTAISVVCALGSLLLIRSRQASVESAAESATESGAESTFALDSLLLLAGALLALLVEFGVSPHIRAHDNLPFWHGLGSGMYLLQWLCSLWFFGRVSSR